MSGNTISSNRFTRRGVLGAGAAAAASAALSSCAQRIGPAAEPRSVEPDVPPPPPAQSGYAQMYAAVSDGGFQIPAVPFERIDPQYRRQEVRDPTGEAPGTVVVSTRDHFLYVVQRWGRAMRYGVGLGRAGFEWSGRANIQWKQHWPRWHPPDEMIERQPELERYRTGYDPRTREWTGGMPPGINNPLGARALYIYQDGRDTLYRLHGSPEWYSIGQSVSSGCVRLINQDVIDLYDRVPEGAPILVT